jgi:hypothetical protein
MLNVEWNVIKFGRQRQSQKGRKTPLAQDPGRASPRESDRRSPSEPKPATAGELRKQFKSAKRTPKHPVARKLPVTVLKTPQYAALGTWRYCCADKGKTRGKLCEISAIPAHEFGARDPEVIGILAHEA